MASIVITINTDGAAFSEECDKEGRIEHRRSPLTIGEEMAFILREMADAYEANGSAPNPRDSDENECGTVEVTD